jgi:thiol:disulfide interchange protein
MEDMTHFITMRISHGLLILSLLFVTGIAGADDVYRCTVNGKTVFTDKPCDGEQLKFKAINTLPPAVVLPPEKTDKTEYNSSKWYYNARGYKTALKVSRRYDVPIFIYYQADWCGYCRKLENNILYKPNVKKSLRYLVKVQITPENGGRERGLFDLMGGTGYPTIVTQDGAEAKPVKRSLMRKRNGLWQSMTADDFIRLIGAL